MRHLLLAVCLLATAGCSARGSQTVTQVRTKTVPVYVSTDRASARHRAPEPSTVPVPIDDRTAPLSQIVPTDARIQAVVSPRAPTPAVLVVWQRSFGQEPPYVETAVALWNRPVIDKIATWRRVFSLHATESRRRRADGRRYSRSHRRRPRRLPRLRGHGRERRLRSLPRLPRGGCFGDRDLASPSVHGLEVNVPAGPRPGDRGRRRTDRRVKGPDSLLPAPHPPHRVPLERIAARAPAEISASRSRLNYARPCCFSQSPAVGKSVGGKPF